MPRNAASDARIAACPRFTSPGCGTSTASSSYSATSASRSPAANRRANSGCRSSGRWAFIGASSSRRTASVRRRAPRRKGPRRQRPASGRGATTGPARRVTRGSRGGGAIKCGGERVRHRRTRDRPGPRRRRFAARGGRLAARLLRARLPDGRRRRRDAAHALGPVDRRMAADRRHAAAAFRRRVAGGLRQVPADAGVPQGQRGHVARRIQGHLLVGVPPPAARARDRPRVPRALSRLPRAQAHPARLRREARGHLRARRAAGRDGLVHGAERARRRPARVAVPAHRAPRARVRDLRRDALARDVAARRAARVRGRSARAFGATLGLRAAPARVPDGADRRLRRRHPRGLCLQQLPADERPPRAARDPDDGSVVEELLLEHGDRAVRPSPRRVDPRRRGGDRVVEAPARERAAARVDRGEPRARHAGDPVRARRGHRAERRADRPRGPAPGGRRPAVRARAQLRARAACRSRLGSEP